MAAGCGRAPSARCSGCWPSATRPSPSSCWRTSCCWRSSARPRPARGGSSSTGRPCGASGSATPPPSAAASLAVAEAKAFAQEDAVGIASDVIELAGTSSADAAHGLDRHWRNARVHTLHDPARWKYHHIGDPARALHA
ncbi:acyl-CoA dehydrogenase family protein [Actinocorallia longicatena]|uniref:acyl-CoA dehydrogenase family protein n=1 Tax=Actinocorallia longicatena TaxID=111803 RepID=UPI0031D9CF3F